MRFHYVPSTYRGRKFGKGFCGGAYRGCARICGGSLDDNEEDTPGPVAVPVNIPVQPAQIQQNLLNFPDITPEMIERARSIIALAEATGKAQPITKKEAGIWSGIKNIGSKIWSGAKAVASNPLVQTAAGIAAPYLIGAVAPALASYVPKALDSVGRYTYNKLDPIYHQEAIKDNSALGNLKEIGSNMGELLTKGAEQIIAAPAAAANAAISAPAKVLGWQAQLANAGANAVKNVFSNAWNRLRGRGYRGGRRARLRKGSPEAKAYMARLRAMRGKKKRSGGMLPKNFISLLKNSPIALRTPMPSLYKNFRGSGYRGGMFRGVKMIDLAQILMQEKNKPDDTKIDIDWVDNFGNERTTTTTKANLERMIKGTKKIQKFYDGKDRSAYMKKYYGTKAWPYQNLSNKRLKKILSSHRNTGVTWAKVKDYWDKRTENGNSDFFKKWMAFNYFYRYDPNNVYSNMLVHGKKNRKNRSIISQVRNIRLKKEGLLDNKIYKDLIPDKFSDVDKDSLIISQLPPISKKQISEHRKNMKVLREKCKKMLEIRKMINKKKRAASRKGKNDLDMTLSPAAAVDALNDDTTGSPPSSILPIDLSMYNMPDDNNDDDDTETETDNEVGHEPAEIASLRKKIDREIVRASGIKNVRLREQVIAELSDFGDNDLANIVGLYNNGGSWKAPATRLKKKLNKITSRITGGLKKL